MDYSPYEKQKEAFDKKLMRYIAARIFTPVSETDACDEGIIDDIGNEVAEITSDNQWAFTPFDRFILACKQRIGDDTLRDLLGSYSWLGDVDPLMIMNDSCESKNNHESKYKAFEEVISAFEGTDYLPDGMSNTTNYLRDDDENYEFPEFKERSSWALTLASFLLYAIRQSDIPTSIDFDGNIMPSTTLTFNVRPYNDYGKCKTFLADNGLLDADGITNAGIKVLHRVAKVLVSSNLLSNVGGRIEERSRDWKNIAGVK